MSSQKSDGFQVVTSRKKLFSQKQQERGLFASVAMSGPVSTSIRLLIAPESFHVFLVRAQVRGRVSVELDIVGVRSHVTRMTHSCSSSQSGKAPQCARSRKRMVHEQPLYDANNFSYLLHEKPISREVKLPEGRALLSHSGRFDLCAHSVRQWPAWHLQKTI